MKGRPRRVEREVALHLSEFFVTIGCSAVQRIPILGRTGPDVTINEMGLAIDVKSRKSVPKGVIPRGDEIVFVPGEWYGCRLDNIAVLMEPFEKITVREVKSSVVVQKWIDHMDEWTQSQALLSPAITTLDNKDEWDEAAHMLSQVLSPRVSYQSILNFKEKGGISALVLHRTGAQIKSSLFLIKQLEVFYDRSRHFRIRSGDGLTISDGTE